MEAENSKSIGRTARRSLSASLHSRRQTTTSKRNDTTRARVIRLPASDAFAGSRTASPRRRTAHVMVFSDTMGFARRRFGPRAAAPISKANMTAYILILFALFDGSATAAVRIGFNSQETCVAAAKEVSANLLQTHPDAKVDWSCVRQ
jgi:hypothetical protein